MDNIINPLTGRRIKYGGPTHRKLLRAMGQRGEHGQGAEAPMPQPQPQREQGPPQARESARRGKVAQEAAQKDKDFFAGLLERSQKLDTYVPVNPNGPGDRLEIPKSKYSLISASLPPAPEAHSWYHHHAPFAQNFGDYVCLKRSTLQELGTFMHDALASDIRSIK